MHESNFFSNGTQKLLWFEINKISTFAFVICCFY